MSAHMHHTSCLQPLKTLKLSHLDQRTSPGASNWMVARMSPAVCSFSENSARSWLLCSSGLRVNFSTPAAGDACTIGSFRGVCIAFGPLQGHCSRGCLKVPEQELTEQTPHRD